jgi:hypothetical protein
VSNTAITFYLPKLVDPSQYDDVDPDADWTRFRNARAQWIPHTYVRLRRAGHAVRIDNRPPEHGIVVVFAGDMRRFLSACTARRSLRVVCAQADRRVPEAALADVIVQHNGLRADGRRRFFIPNWPQGGLVPRHPGRGTSVRTVCYKGHLDNLRQDFLTREWERYVQHRDLRFVIDADLSDDDPRLRELGPHISVGSTSRWNDYTDADVVLAVRPQQRDLHRHKPAVKLVNAWRARVPALLGPEHAYRELRSSRLDYLEVTSVAEAIEALDRLCAQPGLYEEMVANGAQRAAEFSVESVTRQWETLLFSTLTDWRPKRLVRLASPINVPVRRAIRGIKSRAAVRIR